MQAKRLRAHNWSEEEKAVFINAVKNYTQIIENKKICAITNRKKDDPWKNIQENMLLEGYCRNINRMKEQWLRMKVQTKANVRNFKKCTKQTGGGPPPVQPTEIEWQIFELVPHEFTEDQNPFDSDNIIPSLNNEEVSKPQEENVHIIEETFIDIEPQHTDKSENSESPVIKAKKSWQTFSKRMTEYEQKLYELNKQRIEQTMKHADELHAMKLKHEEQYHAERLNLLKLNFQQ